MGAEEAIHPLAFDMPSSSEDTGFVSAEIVTAMNGQQEAAEEDDEEEDIAEPPEEVNGRQEVNAAANQTLQGGSCGSCVGCMCPGKFTGGGEKCYHKSATTNCHDYCGGKKCRAPRPSPSRRRRSSPTSPRRRRSSPRRRRSSPTSPRR